MLFIDLLMLALGLALLLGGGDILVRGASSLARIFGVPPLVIGMTIVAFGTSAPELSVNLLAVLRGNTEISFGNITGSNIANIALILGVAALVRPLAVEGVVIRREIPMMILASLVALVAGADAVLRGSPNSFDRADGLIFLLLFGVFLFYTLMEVVGRRRDDSLLQQAAGISGRTGLRNTAANLALIVGGLAMLILGGKVCVDAAVEVAEALSVPRVVIGLTVVAVGTSLPELVTSVMAAARGHSDIAIGNVVGSNIFNLLLINGVCSTLRPIPVPTPGGAGDLIVMTALAVLLLPLCSTDHRRIVRLEGVLLLVAYAAYIIWRVGGW